MGLGLYLGPVVKTRLQAAVLDETGKPSRLEGGRKAVTGWLDGMRWVKWVGEVRWVCVVVGEVIGFWVAKLFFLGGEVFLFNKLVSTT